MAGSVGTGTCTVYRSYLGLIMGNRRRYLLIPVAPAPALVYRSDCPDIISQLGLCLKIKRSYESHINSAVDMRRICRIDIHVSLGIAAMACSTSGVFVVIADFYRTVMTDVAVYGRGVAVSMSVCHLADSP